MIISFWDITMRDTDGRRFVCVDGDDAADRIRYVYRDLRRRGVNRFDARWTVVTLLCSGRRSHLGVIK